MKIILLLAILFFETRPSQPSHGDYTITATVIGKKNNNGTIIINLYNTSAGFPTDVTKALKSQKIPASGAIIQANFQVPGGTYSISVLHDANNNGKMDKNLFGIPKEGYCVSNNIKGIMSAPAFKN